MRQSIIGGRLDSNLGGPATSYNFIMGGYLWGGTENGCPMPTAGTFDRLYVALSLNVPAGASVVFTVEKYSGGAWADTASTCTIGAGSASGSDYVNSATFAAGDLIRLKAVTAGAWANRTVNWKTRFTGSTPGESILLGACYYNQSNTYYSVPMGGGSARTVEANVVGVCPTGGTLKKLYVIAGLDAGIDPDTWRTTLRVSGVSTALTCDMVADATDAHDTTHNVAIVAGEDFCIMTEPINGPATAQSTGRFGMVFAPTIDGESICVGGLDNAPDTALTEYNHAAGGTNWAAATSVRQRTDACTIKKFYVELTTAPGAGTSYTFTIQLNFFDSTSTLIIADLATTGNDTVHEPEATDQWCINIESTPAGPPAATTVHWGFVTYIEPEEGGIPGISMASKLAAAGII